MSALDYAAPLVLACALVVAVLCASTSLLDGWIDARRRRELDRREREAWRAFRDGGWPR